MSYDNHLMTAKEYDRQSKEYDKVKFRCNCGHRVIIPYWEDKGLCSWCKNYVYKDKRVEFKDRLKEQIRRN